MRDLKKFKGCLVGGAIGDALGYPVEFLDVTEIFTIYGENGITRYHLENGVALTSDDTQMTLFTAVGLLHGITRCHTQNTLTDVTHSIQKAYIDWLTTQIEDYPLPQDRSKVAWLVNIPEFFSSREPGRTCIQALYHGGMGSINNPLNNSKGCGGVMRVAPIGLFFCEDEMYKSEELDLLGAEVAAITHGHALGYIPAAALVHMIRELASGRSADVLSAAFSAVHAVKLLFSSSEHIAEFCEIMNSAILLAQKAQPDADSIHQLGQGWVAESALAIAVYCAVKYQTDFEKAMIAAVNHDGDSDSTGAITGNILGAYLGYDAIPSFFINHLELHDCIVAVAEDLFYGYPSGRIGDSVWNRKYVAIDYPLKTRYAFMEWS